MLHLVWKSVLAFREPATKNYSCFSNQLHGKWLVLNMEAQFTSTGYIRAEPGTNMRQVQRDLLICGVLNLVKEYLMLEHTENLTLILHIQECCNGRYNTTHARHTRTDNDLTGRISSEVT
jgi:hypothetical protein